MITLGLPLIGSSTFSKLLLQLPDAPPCFGSALFPPHFHNSKSTSSMPRRILVKKPERVTRPGIETAGAGDRSGIRVFVVSDLHTEYEDNMNWIESLSCGATDGDVLVVAGDVAETYAKFVLTMSILKDKFDRVFFVPGNHDLWLRREEFNFLDSLEKLDTLLDACQKIGVETKPGIIDDLGIIPLYSWYHESFDEEKDITGVRIPPLEMACKDFHVCKWPDELKDGETSLALYFDSLNDENSNMVEAIVTRCSHILSFSHFVPRQELCPEKRMLFYPHLPKIIGSQYLERRIRAIHGTEGRASPCHVFGHTHFCWDTVLDGIRYVQAPLAYPRERKRRMNGGEDWLPFCIYSGGNFAQRLWPATGLIIMPSTPECQISHSLPLGLPGFMRKSNKFPGSFSASIYCHHKIPYSSIPQSEITIRCLETN